MNLGFFLIYLSSSYIVNLDGLKYSVDGTEAEIIKDRCGNETLHIPQEIVHLGHAYRVTAISDDAFSHCDNIKKLYFDFPSNVKTIGENAFYNCAEIENELVIPASVEEIGEHAFHRDDQIPSLKFVVPSNLRTIGSDAFGHCTSLSGKVQIPNQVKFIGSEAFTSTNISSIYLPTALNKIESGTFNSCNSLLYVDGISNIVEIDSFAFIFCTNLISVNLESCNKLGSSCFSICLSLSTVYFGNGLKNIQEGCFSGCKSLQEIHIPSTVTTIGYQAFEDCNIKKLILNPSIIQINSMAFKNAVINEVFYNGTILPNCTEIHLRINNLLFIDAPEEYPDDTYCGIPIRINGKPKYPPSNTFTPSNAFTASDSKYVELMRLSKMGILPSRTKYFGKLNKVQLVSTSISVFIIIIIVGACLMVYYIHARKKELDEPDISDYLFVSSSSEESDSMSCIEFSYSWEYYDTFDRMDLKNILEEYNCLHSKNSSENK